MNKLAVVFFACVTHFLLVKFGSQFLVPFGYASVIWPAAGIALGLYLLKGWPILVGVFISLLFSLSQDPLITSLPVEAAYALALLSTVQLVVSRRLVLLFSQVPIRISVPYEIIKFLLLTGPVATFVTSTLMYCILSYFLVLPQQTLLYIGVTKWVGDSLSIVLLTPVFLFLYPNIFVKKARKAAAAIITSLLSFSLICFVYYVSNHDYERDQKQQFVNGTASFVEQINSTQSTIKLYLKALEAYFQASEQVNQQEFSAFTSIIQNTSVKVRAIGWIPLVTEQGRPQFESSMKTLYSDNKGIKQLTSTGFQAAPNQPYYLPIYFTSPLQDNQSVIGLDVSTHPIAGKSIKQAIASQDFAVTDIFALVQQQDKKDGVVVYYPIFKKGQAANLDSLLGLVEVVLELKLLLDPMYTSNEEAVFTYQISFGEGNVFTHPYYIDEHFITHHVKFALFDKQGVIKFSSTDSFAVSLINWVDFIIVLVGCLLGVICVMFVFFIVSFNASLEKKVKASTQELTEKNSELILANDAKNLFLANVSHEYRTPLNAIVGFTELATKETEDQVALDYLARISDASAILLSTVNDVLDFSKMQAGQLDLDSKVFKPEEVTSSVIGMLSHLAAEKSIKIEFTHDEQYTARVEGDELRFKQILINLLNNALKFTPKGSIQIDCKCIEQDDGYKVLTIKVIDTGIGIKAEDQQRLFNAFAQAQSSTTRKYGGTGLGLSIVKQLCRLMQGEITVESQEGVGSEFTVVLKLKGVTELQAALAHHEAEVVQQVYDYENMKVLVVEDNKINQIVVQKHLRNLGLGCDFANDGQQALNYLKLQKPDLILMDLQMPVMDGFTASKHIKNDENLKHISIVILSASVGKEEKQQAALLGIEDFIHKPYQQSDLERVLAKYAN
ncbi:ATP-binding protein [Pseudoalteromonas citrea]|uniref:ATP-binding protein n=1 Tax=Pseudoalteromonas citrea TaxID=43655 RepID=UPI00138AE802|nr:ATP-binding protein [Pseudoalteromonas citrea]